MKLLACCTRILACCLLLTSAGPLLAQGDGNDIVIGERLTLTSTMLGEERTVIVGKPAGYDSGDARYPVLYVLDGDTSFNYTSTLVQFLASNGSIPPMLVVAVPNTNRLRDLTPAIANTSESAQIPGSGGADQFRAFITGELMPWVEQHYRTRPYRILVGHSLGGLFVIDAFMAQPELFNSYLAISPSLWWDEQHLIERADTFLDSQPQVNAALYMTMANETGEMAGAIKKLAALLDEKAPAKLVWRFDDLPLESHGSTPLRSTYQGLEFIFADWSLRDPLDTYNRYGIEAVERFYVDNGGKFGEDRATITQPAIMPILLGLMDAERFAELAVLMDRYREIAKPTAGFFEDLAAGLRQDGDVEQAIRFYRRALELDPERSDSRQALSELTQENPAN